jgi:hypothetical protein
LHLKDDAYFAHTDDGMYALSYDGLIRLDELITGEVVDTLTAALQAGMSFDMATRQLPQEQRPAARELERILRNHGLLVDSAKQTSGSTQGSDAQPYGRPVIVTGEPVPVARLVGALRACGADAHGANEVETAEVVAPVVRDGDPALHVGGNEDYVCWSFADPDTAGPVPLAVSAVRRARSNAFDPDDADGNGEPMACKTFTAIAARQITHATRRAAEARSVTVLDRRTLRTTTHQVTVHPYDVPAVQLSSEATRARLAMLEAGVGLTEDDIEERWDSLSDSRFGAFSALEDTDFRQLPLKVVRVRASDPSGLSTVPPAVFGVGTTRARARARAILTALATYTSNVVDPRLLVNERGRFLTSSDSDPVPLLASVRAGEIQACIRADDLIDDEECILPAALAFPALGPKVPVTTPCGASAGLDWKQALTYGLLQHCVQVTISERSQLGWQSFILRKEDFEHDAEVRYLLAMVRAAGIEITLRDITGPLGVPVVACYSSAEGSTFYGGGVDLVDAVREALTGTVFGYQVRDDPALSAALPAGPPSVWVSPNCSEAPDPHWLVSALENFGYAPSVIALDHDRAVSEAFPYVLRVVV